MNTVKIETNVRRPIALTCIHVHIYTHIICKGYHNSLDCLVSHACTLQHFECFLIKAYLLLPLITIVLLYTVYVLFNNDL